MKFAQRPLLAVLLVTLYPLLTYFSSNIFDVKLQALAIYLLVSGLLATGCFYGSLFLLRDPYRAGTASAAIMLATTQYQSIYTALALPFDLRHRHFLVLLAAVGAALCLTLRKRNPSILVEGITLAATGLCLYALTRTGLRFHEVDRLVSARPVPAPLPPRSTSNPTNPSVVLIVLDEYARGDVLKEVFDKNNDSFLEELKNRGFLVADQSLANYSFTLASLASLLNFEYLPALPGDTQAQASDRSWRYWAYWIQHNRLQTYFRTKGYQTQTLAYFSATTMTGQGPSLFSGQFYDLLRYGTIASALDAFRAPRPAHVYSERAATLGIFQSLQEIKLTQPTFLFAHILCPHRPLVFTADGKMLDTSGLADEEAYRRYYPGQIEFVSNQTLKCVDSLLKNSAQPPIIIVMSDHGSMSLKESSFDWEQPTNELIRERMPNLCAIYLPNHAKISTLELSQICPVNVFRIVLNKVFGERLPLLPRRSVWIHGGRDVTNLF